MPASTILNGLGAAAWTTMASAKAEDRSAIFMNAILSPDRRIEPARYRGAFHIETKRHLHHRYRAGIRVIVQLQFIGFRLDVEQDAALERLHGLQLAAQTKPVRNIL